MNSKRFIATASFFTGLVSMSFAHASNLGQFDARSLALGGAGVAGAQSANAAAYNPALLAAESNKKSFSFIFPVIGLQAVDENDFVDTIENLEASINDDGGLDTSFDDLGVLAESTCGVDPCYKDAALSDIANKANEITDQFNSLNNSNALINLSAGFALQVGKKIPMAFIVDGGLYTRLGVKFASSDANELNLYSKVMADGEITQTEVTELGDLVTVDTSGGAGNWKIDFVRGSNSANELQSLVEVIGATYYEFGVSFADTFDYAGKHLAVGITPKVVNVDTIKYHQSAEAEDVDDDDIFDDDNITSNTDFNADIGVVFMPIDAQPLQVGVTLKNLFSRSYDLKKTSQELAIDTAAAGGDQNAEDDLAAFNFKQRLKIEPQITAGVAYDLRLFNFLADIDLNEAEVLGRTTQHLALGAEFDARFFRFQLGYRTSIGGDDEADLLSAGTSIGPVGLAAVYSEDNVGVVAQFGMSF